MVSVTVFRHVPPPIIGTLGVIQDRAFEAFEERLDWLEVAGFPVERFDPSTSPGALAAREAARDLLSVEGDECLPLILLNDAVVWRGGYPSRAQLARTVGRGRYRVDPDPDAARQLAGIRAAVASGSEDEGDRQAEPARKMAPEGQRRAG